MLAITVKDNIECRSKHSGVADILQIWLLDIGKTTSLQKRVVAESQRATICRKEGSNRWNVKAAALRFYAMLLNGNLNS
ncbi:hypothetical protein [Noviherbaspirillum malthae]|uniref:hypothetical protein n=1 Tax=Noviherbaspirillum malthae TaxID=1260987 RepID=UPI00188E7337|nr:hypothetical protein [Noviherbaspirillum malthae]